MEPRQSGPGTSFEHAPTPPRSNEAYGLPELDPERGGGHDVERGPARQEGEAVTPAVITLPTPLPQVDDTNTPVQGASVAADVPDAAADEDLIEKEWVDKAKKIVEETKDDPYRRELEINKLQREYIRKRYGREIGEASS